ncbi:pseudouridine synthase [Zopfia rhizophila CBS 207.26]|uniref:tRNA pseudouridine(55) synthase n=1 Tax=Zopfia rhizophila CBS 207.26 TaxID=1314779 RepID=A0A6A6EHE9_9PEZI|nr:pseudouridine synthase [Zopfia rhizophila CBS 207.26]
MASSTKESRKVIEGVFAINKPQFQSSAGVLRELQSYFNPSPLFGPWLDHQRDHLIRSGSSQKKINRLQVKLGHGGTLDPLATGVLVVGVGKGTKCLPRFLECTKSYECVVLFGAATDSYDCMGKIVSRAPYEHVTKGKVEEALSKFRGEIMQKPSIFSALKVDGKKMYEYARAGGDVPEVKARPVEVHELEMVEWLEPGTHDFAWPTEEVGSVEKKGAEKLIGENSGANRGTKRARSEEEDDLAITNTEYEPKKPKTDDEPMISGALPIKNGSESEDIQTPQPEYKDPFGALPGRSRDQSATPPSKPSPPPAARLRMTVTSGFYVRSLCHDLGLAVNSLGLMSSLIRTRQGDYELGKNVLEYSDLGCREQTWEPKVEQYLKEFMEKEGWEPEEVDEDGYVNREGFEREEEENDNHGPWQSKRRKIKDPRGFRNRGRGRPRY